MPATEITVRNVRFTEAPAKDRPSGLLGWVRFEVGDALILDGVAVRRTREGRVTLSFPARRDRFGQDHPLVRPLDQYARTMIERQVLAALPSAIEESRR